MTPQEVAKDSDILSGNDGPNVTSEDDEEFTDKIMMARP